MGVEYRKACLDHAFNMARRDAVANMTDDEILSEWGLQRRLAAPLHFMSARDVVGQQSLRAALKELREYCTDASEHVAASVVARAEEHIERLEEALAEIRDRHIPDQPMADDCDEAAYVRKHHLALRQIANAALER